MRRDRVISKEGAVLFWLPVAFTCWAGAVYLWPRQTAVVFAVLVLGMGVALWRDRRHNASPDEQRRSDD